MEEKIKREEALLERFMRYAAVSSQSDAKAKNVPSSEGQRALAELLAKELQALGFESIEISEHAVLTARATCRRASRRRSSAGVHTWIRLTSISRPT